jgi:hypothetical protein
MFIPVSISEVKVMVVCEISHSAPTTGFVPFFGCFICLTRIGGLFDFAFVHLELSLQRGVPLFRGFEIDSPLLLVERTQPEV